MKLSFLVRPSRFIRWDEWIDLGVLVLFWFPLWYHGVVSQISRVGTLNPRREKHAAVKQGPPSNQQDSSASFVLQALGEFEKPSVTFWLESMSF